MLETLTVEQLELIHKINGDLCLTAMILWMFTLVGVLGYVMIKTEG